jgi:hypothetical protein
MKKNSITLAGIIRSTALAFLTGAMLIGFAVKADTEKQIELLTNDSIVQLVKAGISEEIVINMINTQPTRFDVGAAGILTLHSNGVGDKIISKMVLRGQLESATPQAGLSGRTPDAVSNAIPSASTESHKIKEPEYVGVFFRLNPKDGELIPLERQNTQMRAVAGGFIAIGAKVAAQVDGEKSPIRFKRGDKLDFVVKLNSQQNDPQSQIGFASFESGKGKRQIVLAKGSAAPFVGTSVKDVSQSKIVSDNVVKYGESSFKVSPVEQLAPGEYVLGIKGVAVSFCFGVDSDESSSSQSAGATNVITDPAVEKLCEELEQDNPGKVKDALKKLSKMPQATEAIPKILPCLTDSKPDVVREALKTLAAIGNQDAVPAIIPLLTHDRPDVVHEACRTLAAIGGKDVIPSLQPLLTNSRSGIRDDAYKAITKLKAK